MVAAALAHGREHRDRHRELQRAREVDHQHGEHLRDIAREQICQRRAAERPGDEAVGQPRGLVLGGGLELFGFFDHAHDAVIPAAAERLFHRDDAFALLDDGPGVDVAAGALGNGQGLAGDGGLVDRGFAGDDLAVERDEVAGADDHPVARADVADGDEQLGLAGLQPDLVDVQGHRAREIGDGLLVRPLLEDLAQPQHEHDGARGIEIAAEHRDRHGRGVEHGDGELAVPEGLEPLLDVLDRAEQRDGRRDGIGQEQPGERAAADRKDKLVLILAVELPGGMLRHERDGLLRSEGEGGQRPDERGPVRLVGDDGVLRAVKDLDGGDAGDIFQIIFQNIGLAQRHAAAGKMHAHTPGGLMQNGTFHRVL